MATAAGVEAVLKLGQRVVFELGITSGRIEAQFTYRRQLTGGVFVHYGKRKDGHYFRYLPLAHLYDAHTLSQTQRGTLRVDFYSHTRTTQRDPMPGEFPDLNA